MQFEIGKKYTREGNVMRVLFLTEKSALVTYEHLVKDVSFVKVGQELLWKRNETEPDWHEYKDPVVEKMTLRVFKDGAISYFVASCTSANHLGGFELTMTDGRLTGVRLV